MARGSMLQLSMRRFWTKSLILLTAVLISLAGSLRHYRSIVTQDRLVAEKRDSIENTKIETVVVTKQSIEPLEKSAKQNHNLDSTPNNYNKSYGHMEENFDFERTVWPKLKQKLCPKGIPKTSLGPSLFELGRIEFGLEANATAATNEKEIIRNRERTADFFYDGGFGFTLFLDGEDPTNTLLYAPVWKCANDQIHSYFHQIFNRRINGEVREKSRSIHRENDVYSERLNIKDLEKIFHEELKRSEDSTTTHQSNEEAYFTFNKTVRSKPCVFTVLRDPISHFLSGYNEIEYRLIHGDRGAPQLPKDSKKLASYTKIAHDQGPEKREERFTTFVKNLIKEHPSFSVFGYYKHFASMSRMLPTMARLDLLPSNSDSSWYLPTLDHLSENFPQFLANRCPTMTRNYQERLQQSQQCDQSWKSHGDNDYEHTATMPYPAMERMGLHKSSKDQDGTYMAAKTIWKNGGFVAKALCALHAMDYACFELPIPLLCRNVYSSERFVQEILKSP